MVRFITETCKLQLKEAMEEAKQFNLRDNLKQFNTTFKRKLKNRLQNIKKIKYTNMG
jgi:hypothetical protein